MLAEYGIIMAKGIQKFKNQLINIIDNVENELTHLLREMLSELFESFLKINERIKYYDKKVKAIFHNSADCQKISKLRGIGPLTATGIVAAIGNPHFFQNGRHCSAWLGLVPRQHSSGGKEKLLGISKRGDSYLRSILIQGCQAVIRWCHHKNDPQSIWLNKLIARCGKNKAAVALANKNVRVIWALLAKKEEYHAPLICT